MPLLKVSRIFLAFNVIMILNIFNTNCSPIAGTPTEIFATMERDLIYQVKLCEECRLAFTRLVLA